MSTPSPPFPSPPRRSLRTTPLPIARRVMSDPTLTPRPPSPPSSSSPAPLSPRPSSSAVVEPTSFIEKQNAPIPSAPAPLGRKSDSPTNTNLAPSPPHESQQILLAPHLPLSSSDQSTTSPQPLLPVRPTLSTQLANFSQPSIPVNQFVSPHPTLSNPPVSAQDTTATLPTQSQPPVYMSTVPTPASASTSLPHVSLPIAPTFNFTSTHPLSDSLSASATHSMPTTPVTPTQNSAPPTPAQSSTAAPVASSKPNLSQPSTARPVSSTSACESPEIFNDDHMSPSVTQCKRNRTPTPLATTIIDLTTTPPNDIIDLTSTPEMCSPSHSSSLPTSSHASSDSLTLVAETLSRGEPLERRRAELSAVAEICYTALAEAAGDTVTHVETVTDERAARVLRAAGQAMGANVEICMSVHPDVKMHLGRGELVAVSRAALRRVVSRAVDTEFLPVEETPVADDDAIVVMDDTQGFARAKGFRRGGVRKRRDGRQRGYRMVVPEDWEEGPSVTDHAMLVRKTGRSRRRGRGRNHSSARGRGRAMSSLPRWVSGSNQRQAQNQTGGLTVVAPAHLPPLPPLPSFPPPMISTEQQQGGTQKHSGGGASASWFGASMAAAGARSARKENGPTSGKQSKSREKGSVEKTPVAVNREPLTAANRGFALLQRMGWREGDSLGASGQAANSPIAVTRRSGRYGIGAEHAPRQVP